MNRRYVIFHGILLVFGFYFIPGTSAQWVKTVDLPGGRIRDYCSVDSNHFLAMGGRIFHSDNEGASWTPLISPGKNSEVYSIEALEGTILAGTPEGVYQSSMKNLDWSIFNRPGLPSSPALSIWTYLGHQYIGSEGAVYQSIDQGKTWTGLNSGLSPDARITCFAGIVKIAVSGSENRGIFITGSDDWSHTYYDSTNNRILELEVIGTKVFAVTDNEVLESGNLGADWGPSTLALRNITSLLGDGEYIYAGTDRGMSFSTDKGKTWKPLDQGILENTEIRSLEKVGGNIFASTDSSVWRMTAPLAGTPHLPSGALLPPPRLLRWNGPQSLIEFTLPHADQVNIRLADFLGRTVWSLGHLRVNEGRRSLRLNTGSFAPGRYLLHIDTRNGKRLQTVPLRF